MNDFFNWLSTAPDRVRYALGWFIALFIIVACAGVPYDMYFRTMMMIGVSPAATHLSGMVIILALAAWTWGAITGVASLQIPAQRLGGLIGRIIPIVAIGVIAVMGWSWFSTTGFGTWVTGEIADQSAQWRTEGEYAHHRTNLREFTRQLVLVRDTEAQVSISPGTLSKPVSLKRGDVVLARMADTSSEGKHSTLIPVVKSVDSDEILLVRGEFLAPAGHLPVLESVESRTEVLVRDSDGVREFYLELAPGEESKVLIGSVDCRELSGKPWEYRRLGQSWANKTGKTDQHDTGYSPGLILKGGPEGNRFRITQIYTEVQ